MKHPNSAFAPRSRFLALEPRVLFDGAAAVAVEQQAPVAEAHVDAPATTPSTLVVIDARVGNATQLAAEAGQDKSAQVVMVGNAEDGLAAISKALEAAGKVDAIQVYSHGAAGQFTLGNWNVSADNIATAGQALGGWASHLSADADILLLGCNVGAGDSGRALISQLATLTGADVAASTNNTGSTEAGGDWTLEVATGSIESVVPVLAYEGLLVDASPTVALSVASMDTLLGGQFTFTATFTNSSTQVGFAPFIDLILPATGKDGAGAEIDDGITFVSATYLGQTVTAYTLTFDASGNATHPLAKDASGQSVIVNAATYGARAGDQLVVLQLPYASVIDSQPGIPVVITCQLSDLADTDGSPDLTIKARGGFQFGNDSANNPVTDPSLLEAGAHNLVVHPTGLQLTQTINMPEGETVTGPNFVRSVTVTATPPPGQTLTNVDITQTVPGELRYVSITPGAGGQLISITLANGNVITDPGLLPQIMAVSPHLSAYTVRYASLSAAADTVVSFYVPEKDVAGADVLNPVTGDDRTITFGAPTASGQWVPLDTRDQTVDPGPPSVVVPATVTANGSPASFVAKSVALQKSVTISSNVGATGLSPGDELQYSLNVDLSDYFVIGKTLLGSGNLQIVDTLGDGQSFVTGSAQASLQYNGQTISIPLLITTAPGASGTKVVTIDIAQALLDNSAIFGGALIGDLAVDGILNGATRLFITYRTTVAQAYTTAHPQSEINEGDSLGNNATVGGTFLSNFVTLTGSSEEDTSAASMTVPTHTMATSIVTVNGATPPANGELKPGDVVTFKLAYNLETGDYENFKLTAYMPLPLFNLGATGSFTGSWAYGSGNTNVDTVDSVTVGAGNSLVFDFGNYATSDLGAKRIEVQFTLTVGNQPFGDNRPLTVLGQSDQLTTIPTQQHLVSSGVVNIASIAEPVLTISHGVVGPAGPGSDGVVTPTPSGPPITDIGQLDGNLTDMDAGDTYQMATTIKNSGGLGAFDVTSTVTLPTGLSFSTVNLAGSIAGVFRGSFGAPLSAGVDYSVSGNTITFLDAGGVATLKEGRPGTANDLSGANVLVILYNVRVDNTAAASQNFQTTAALTNYSSVNGGPDFTPDDLTDTATETMAAPSVRVFFAAQTGGDDGVSATDDDSSASHTTGADLVIGESMLYDIVVTLPEGTTQNLRVTDLIPSGMALDASFNSNTGYQVITSRAQSQALPGDFIGSVSVASTSHTAGDGNDLALSFSGATTATADNDTSNNSFVIRVRLIASNVTGNQAGVTRPNSAELVYSDPDGDTPNGSTALDRTVALSGGQPGITVREPTVVLGQTYAITGAGGDPNSVVKDDVVTYTFTLTNPSASSDFNAFDLTFSDTLPTLLNFSGAGLGLLSVTSAGGASGVIGDFEIAGGVLRSVSGANIDIPTGGSITIVVAGKVLDAVGSVASFSNTASMQWTSLDGAVANERSGVDGTLFGGTLNDYRVEQTTVVKTASGANLSRVGGMVDTPVPSPTDAAQTVAVGEIIRYRFATRIIAGNSLDSNFVVTLPDGLSFIDDGTTKVGLLGSSSTFTWSAGGSLGNLSNDPYFITGGATARDQTLLPSDPATSAVTAILNSGRINTSDPRAIKFAIGDLINTEVDADAEIIYIEFNVRVDNILAVDTNDSFNVSAKYFSGSTLLSTTNTTVENVVEPNLNNIQKVVTDFDPRTSLTTGIATVTVNFSNAGDGIAYETHLTDSMSGGANYALSNVVIGGTTYLPGSLPAGVTVTTAGGITADFSTVAAGASIQLVYTVEVPNNVAAPSTNAVLTWSSLPESFTGYLGSAVGADSAANGERIYTAQEAAGLGIISGTLWDDTLTPTNSTTPDSSTRLATQTLTLTWAGADGDLATTGDNRTFTATSDSSGNYHFGVLPSGNFQIVTVNPVNGYVFGADTDNAAVRIDSDGGTLGSVTVSALGEGATGSAVFGYVRDNDAPVNTLPASPTTLEDTPLSITGIFISDIDASGDDLTVTLSVNHGTLNLTVLTDVTVSAGALNTATVTIRGAYDKLNTALQSLVYTPSLNYNGTDKLTVTTNDLGHTGDANGNLVPSESADALTDTDKLTINITPVNDAPIGVNDVMIAIEKGGVNNSVGGLIGAAAVLKNDIDVDIATNADSLSVTKIGFGVTAPTTTVGFSFTPQLGTYGELFINSAGNARYVVDNNNAAVQALRLSGNTLTETFTYELRDQAGLTSTATISVTIEGANDTPIGVDDVGTTTEAGGVANGTGGSPAGGNVLTDAVTGDTDVDANGETKAVEAIRIGQESAGGVFTGVPDGGNATITGIYGDLTIASSGAYTYTLRQSDPAVQALRAGEIVTEYFSYTVNDALFDRDIAQLTINITGADDTPVAVNDLATGQAGKVVLGVVTGTPVDAVGNALTNPPGADSDVDLSETRTVTTIRTGTEAAGSGTAGTVSTALTGQYGSLTIQADGSFRYVVDSLNATVQALPDGSFLTEFFTYTVTDQTDPAALSDEAQIEIRVYGVNNPPIANDVTSIAVEKGGVANGTVGTDPSADALANDTDPEGFPLTVSAIRTGTEAAGSGTVGTVGSVLAGQYGTLTIQANGTYTYVVNNALVAVEELRTTGNKLYDYFTYTETDGGTPIQSDSGQITIEIRGANDNPIGADDTGTAVEAGGLNNASAGSNATGDVLTNDTDIDSVANGETKTVSVIRTGAEAASGTAGTVGAALTGTYGALTLNADGSYTYVVNNANADVQALRTSGNTLTELFTYTIRDAAGATDLAQLSITIQGANDTPLANPDIATAIEAGGFNNGTAGTNPSGNVLSNDSDVDTVNGETKAVSAFTNSASVAGTLGVALAGSYGSLTLNADGSYTYVVDNANATVQALRTSSNTLTETFSYTMQDTAGATSSTTLSITIRGANDNPLAVNDTGAAIEAGGLNNGAPGSNATGDVLLNDTDVDNVAFGETRTVSAIRTGNETGSGTAGTVGSALAGSYGALTLNANGTYSYVVDNTNAAVQALRTTANTLSETFTYTMRDAAGVSDIAQLTITIQGANDTPLAVDDSAYGWPEIYGSPGSGRNPTGNVITNDSDVDAGDSKSVSGIRTGTEVAGGSLTAVGSGTSSGSGERVNGSYGWLNIGADGSYLYEVDFARTSSMAPGDIVVDYFTYELKDTGGLTDLAQLSITIRGKNNPPIAVDVVATAIEAGGVANGSPGIDPAGDVTANDFDFEGDALTVNAIRTGAESGSGTAGTIGSELAGAYGWLTQQSNGTFTYRVDNANPLVEALRSSGDTLTELFTYTVSDIYGAADQATIAVTIRGANDTPVALADAGTAVETGGVANATPGSDATGNVLLNDSDVDAYGETKAVAEFAFSGGGSATAGSGLLGAYGTLTLNANGSYIYVVDNTNPAVEALRTPAETLAETFTYTVVDAAGATTTATLTITITGANDNPQAMNDSGLATDQSGPPVTAGNVLPNDSDVDGGDSKLVVAIRSGTELGSGTSGLLGTSLQGAYGSLLINADGSYTYTVDMTNPEVQQAAGRGRILQDVFTYTVADTAGGTDQAELQITLDIAAPHQDLPASPFFGGDDPRMNREIPVLNFTPIVYVERIVDQIQRNLSLSDRRNEGARPQLAAWPEIQAQSIGAGLGIDRDIFVQAGIRDSQSFSRYDASIVDSRAGLVSLSADGLLADGSLFTPDDEEKISIPVKPVKRAASPSFSEQLQKSAEKVRPLNGLQRLAAKVTENAQHI